MKRLLPLLLLSALLTGCAKETPPAPLEETGSLWTDTLDPAVLPTVLNESVTLEDDTLVCLIGMTEEADISLYSVWFFTRNFPDLLIRYGNHLQLVAPGLLAPFSVSNLSFTDMDQDGSEELACIFQALNGRTALAVYEWGNGWTAHMADCGQLVLDQLDTDWNSQDCIFTMICAGQSVTQAFPKDVAPDRLVLGETLCNYTREGDTFTVALDAYLPVLQSSVAFFCADVLYNGQAFTLTKLSMTTDPPQESGPFTDPASQSLNSTADAVGTPLDLADIDLNQLPTEPLAMTDLFWRELCPDIYMLAALPDADIALYAVNQNDGIYSPDPLFLRYGTSLQWLDQGSFSVRYTPTLSWADFDGDGDFELAAVYCVGYGTSCFLQELHLYEWDGSGWTDRQYPTEKYEAQARQMVSYGYSAEDLLFSVTAKDRTISGPACASPTGLTFGEWAFFEIDGSRLSLRLNLCAEYSKGLPQCIGELTAEVIYDGQSFSLVDPLLSDAFT